MTDDLPGADRLLGRLAELAPGLGLAATVFEVVPGWATVELDRAEAELRSAAGPATGARRDPLAMDVDLLLGASVRPLDRPGRTRVLLIEPFTEGRLAACLARWGEGLAVAWLLLGPDYDDVVGRARERGVGLSAEGDGPLGRERLVVGGPIWGPHVLLVAERGAGTIER